MRALAPGHLLPSGAGRSTWPRSRPFPNQAFRWGDRAYGFQFHVEVDGALVEGWEPYLPAGVTLDRLQLAEVETVGRRLLRRFIEHALTPGSAAEGPAGAPDVDVPDVNTAHRGWAVDDTAGRATDGADR